MKYLIVGDPHGKPSNIKTLKKMFDLINTLEFDKAIFLGDLFDTFSIIRSEVLNAYYEYFTKVNKPHILLVGNHDLARADSHDNHSLKPFSELNNVTVVDKPLQDGDFGYIPYYKHEKDFETAAYSLSADYIFCHQSFNGAQFENGFFDPEGMKLSTVAGFNQVISGHIHYMQNIANVWFPGTPFQHSFGDVGHDKGIYIWDTEGGEIDRYEIDAPRYHQIEGDMNLIIESLSRMKIGDHYKLIVKDTLDNINKLNNTEDFQVAFRKYNIKKFDDIIRTKADNKVIIRDSLAPSVMLEEYIYNVLESNLDKDELYSIAKGFLDG